MVPEAEKVGAQQGARVIAAVRPLIARGLRDGGGANGAKWGGVLAAVLRLIARDLRHGDAAKWRGLVAATNLAADAIRGMGWQETEK